MEAIGVSLRLQLWGEVKDLVGVLDSDAAYDVKTMENAEGIVSEGDWGYYARQIEGLLGQFLKAWVRWNVAEEVYDYFLVGKAGEVFSHATPSVGPVF